MDKIKIAIAGVGNCASSLIQGIHYYSDKEPHEAVGLMHWQIGGYSPCDIEVVAAFDIDRRKVGKNINKAIFSSPNCTKVFYSNLPDSDVIVQMGKILDGFSDHMRDYDEKYTFVLSNEPEPDKGQVIKTLNNSGAEIFLNYLPVGSEDATKFYAECALEANIAFVNNIPVFIAIDPKWAERFKEKNLH